MKKLNILLSIFSSLLIFFNIFIYIRFYRLNPLSNVEKFIKTIKIDQDFNDISKLNNLILKTKTKYIYDENEKIIYFPITKNLNKRSSFIFFNDKNKAVLIYLKYNNYKIKKGYEYLINRYKLNSF